MAPGGLITSPPHPELEHWLGKGTRSPPYACWGGFNTHNPSSHLPLPSCSGWCPNASTSHLGLPKPVLTVVGGGWAWRALTLDGNTVVQGLAEVQIILLIMHSGKQLPRTKGIQQTRNGPTSPTTVRHASSVISTFIWSHVSLWRLLL